MAHQDYVSRPRNSNKNKKNNPYKKGEHSTTINFKTKVIAVITFSALIGFGYFLWSIKDNQPSPIETQQIEQINKTSEAKLPEPPKEKWSYRKDLADKEVEQGEYEVVDRGPWKMQCASFKSNDQAQALKAKIAFLGIESKVIKSQGKNGVWYKVILGPYKRKRSAEKDRHKLKRNKVNYCQIWLWR
jgi:cell division protein FtsN